MKHLYGYPNLLRIAGEQLSPALVANYLYVLVKLFNSFYQNVSIFGEENLSIRSMRLMLCMAVAKNIQSASNLLGISLPNKIV